MLIKEQGRLKTHYVPQSGPRVPSNVKTILRVPEPLQIRPRSRSFIHSLIQEVHQRSICQVPALFRFWFPLDHECAAPPPIRGPLQDTAIAAASKVPWAPAVWHNDSPRGVFKSHVGVVTSQGGSDLRTSSTIERATDRAT